MSSSISLPYPRHMSRMLSASRMPPSAARAITIKAPGVTFAPLPSAASFRRPWMSLTAIRPKSNRWHRLRIVSGSFCGSVVARMKTMCAGGSSSVFSSALNAEVDSICTSSMMYTLYLPYCGGYFTVSRKSRISSTPLLLAASISMMSRLSSFSIRIQFGHFPQGSPFSGCSQLMALARIFAVEVLPVPREPQNRYACAIRSLTT